MSYQQITNPMPVNQNDGAGNAIGSMAISTGTVAGTNGSLIAMGGTNFVSGTGNSSTTQLGAGATFTGTIENVYSQQAISILLTSDQNGTLTVYQYIDVGGTRIAQTNIFSIIANVGFSRCLIANGNYHKLTFTNNGASTTTTFNLNTAYGTLSTQNSLGNIPVSISDVNGIAIAGQQLSANSVPVVPAADSAGVSDLTAALKTIYSFLANPVWQEVSSGRLRVVLDATGGAQTLGTVTTVTTCSTVTSVSQVAGIAANSFVYDTMYNQWANAIRSRVV